MRYFLCSSSDGPPRSCFSCQPKATIESLPPGTPHTLLRNFSRMQGCPTRHSHARINKKS